jgi:hypothetical protein
MVTVTILNYLIYDCQLYFFSAVVSVACGSMMPQIKVDSNLCRISLKANKPPKALSQEPFRDREMK